MDGVKGFLQVYLQNASRGDILPLATSCNVLTYEHIVK